MPNVNLIRRAGDASERRGPQVEEDSQGRVASKFGDEGRVAAQRQAFQPRSSAAVRPYFNTAQAAHFLGVGWRKLMRLRVEGAGPLFRRHGRLIVYHPDDLEAWSRSRADGASADD